MKLKWFLSNDKAEKTTLLEDNTKIKTIHIYIYIYIYILRQLCIF